MAAAETPRTKYDFAVTLKDSGQLVGGCGLYLNDEQRQGYIGYVLHRRFWGQGYATELAGALVDFGFRILGLHRITAFCDPANAASARVIEKTGMRREGLMRQDAWVKGEWRDTLYFAILGEEWRASHA
jgi:RimJ/RimL family protein N-acetyltransferase